MFGACSFKAAEATRAKYMQMKWSWNCGDDILSFVISPCAGTARVIQVGIEEQGEETSYNAEGHSLAITTLLTSLFEWMFSKDLSRRRGLVFENEDAVLFVFPQSRDLLIGIVRGGSDPTYKYVSIHFEELFELNRSLKLAIDEVSSAAL